MQRSLFSHLKQPEAALAARVLFQLDELVGFSGVISKRKLERKMNANKQPHWPAAWQLLIARDCIRVSIGKNRQQLIQLVSMPVDLQALSVVTGTRPHQRRPQTQWFKERLPEFLRRDGYYDRADEIEEEEEEDFGPLEYAPGDPLAR